VSLEMYTRKSSRRVDSPAIAVTPTWRLALNAAATRLLAEAGIKSVILFWDASKCRLVMRAAERGAANSFRVTSNRGNSSAAVAVIGFLKYIEWNAQERQTVQAKWNASERMLEATLPSEFIGSTKPLTPKPGKRAAKQGE
jgi:hypothetical protein